MFDRSYFMEPDKGAVKAYTLLRRALEETDRTAIAQFSLRQKTRLAHCVPAKGADASVAAVGRRGARGRLPEPEGGRAGRPSGAQDGIVTDRQHGRRIRPDKFSDEYQDQLRQLIAAKLEQGDALDTAATFGEEGEEEADRGEVVDLMEALRRSVEQNRSARKTAETKPSARKSTAKKASAKKPPAKKPPAKKAATKKTTTTKSAKKAS